jgi:uncharacterized protein
MIKRSLFRTISKRISDNKAIILLGPRQAGKSTLLKELEIILPQPVKTVNGDEADVRALLTNSTSSQLKSFIGNAKTLVIDEAQRIENVGLTLKLITDNLPTKIVATGSSAFELANKINEPLTGRKWEHMLFPISYTEMVNHTSQLEERRLLETRLVYGYYPEVVNSSGKEIDLLKQLANSYLYKDILMWQRIQKPERLEKLAQALAFQVGSEVSYHELGQMTGLDNETVERYLLLLERAFIIFRLTTFSRNLRNELKKTRKIYFFDNGLRNALINQFGPIGMRQDVGALWENFLISERMKYIQYNELYRNRYFWRTHTQQEIDYIEEYNGKLCAFEFKWNPKAKVHFPNSFLEAYPGVETSVITPANFEEFVGAMEPFS